MTGEIEQIWAEYEAENAATHKAAENFQLLLEQSIGNLAALKMLSDNSIEEAVKNS